MTTDAAYIEMAYDLFDRTGPLEVADLVEPFAEWSFTLVNLRSIVECLGSIDPAKIDSALRARAVELSAILDRAADLVATETLRHGHEEHFEAVNHARALFDALTTGNSLRLLLLPDEP